MPGIGGVLPGFARLFSSSCVGMPGIFLLPIGMLTAFIEIPGGMFADGGIGFAESPAGIFAGSSLISLFPAAAVFELEFAVEESDPEPHPKLEETTTRQSNKYAILSMTFKNAVPV